MVVALFLWSCGCFSSASNSGGLPLFLVLPNPPTGPPVYSLFAPNVRVLACLELTRLAYLNMIRHHDRVQRCYQGRIYVLSLPNFPKPTRARKSVFEPQFTDSFLQKSHYCHDYSSLRAMVQIFDPRCLKIIYRVVFSVESICAAESTQILHPTAKIKTTVMFPIYMFPTFYYSRP